MSLISVAALAERLQAPGLSLLDARFALNDAGAGRAAYAQAHLPGALYVDLDADLSGPKTDPRLGRHPLPAEAQWQAVLERSGIAAEGTVVVYDQSDGAMAAARAWFLLRLAGHADVHVLDGGMDAWRAAGLPVEAALPVPAPTHYPVRYRNAMLVPVAELKALLAEPGAAVLLDARAPERYRGELEPLDRKAGHIPGARNRPFQQNLSDGLFKSAERLRAEFAPLTAGKASILLSCGSGVTACHNALALSHAGIDGWRLFVPSWSGWIADDGNPVTVGAQPG